MEIRTKYDYGQRIYHVLPCEFNDGIITSIEFKGKGTILYQVTWADRSISYHITEELTTEKPFM